MDELLQADPTLFQGALQFLSRAGHGFILVREIGGTMEHDRAWPRWPLRRLFAIRRPSLITNPHGGQRALAVPFTLPGEQHVVVAPLSVQTLDDAQQAFLDSLRSLILPTPTLTSRSDGAPRFVWLGAPSALSQRVQSIMQRRGWPLAFAPTLGHVLMLLQDDRVDIALFERDSLHNELASLRALRHSARIGDAPIVYFTDEECEPEVQTLVDYCVPIAAGEGELLRMLKAAAALVSRSRSRALRTGVEHMERKLRACADYAELAERAAQDALQLGPDAVSVMLVDPAGGVHAAHLPFESALGDHWPTPFMTGEKIVHTHAVDAFFEEAFDDAQFAERLRGLRPISAAALPVGNGAHIIGTLLAFSLYRPMYEPEFDALATLCENVASCAEALSPVRLGGPWQQAMLGEIMIEAFEGPGARASIRVSCEGENAAIVMLEREDDRLAAKIVEQLLSDPDADLKALLETYKFDARGILVGLVENGSRFRYACEGLPLPLRVPLTGPVEAVRSAQRCETGTIPLGAQSATLVYCTDFAAQVEPARLVGVIQSGLRSSRAMLARGLPSLGSRTQKLAFACITMLSSAVESPRPSALA